MQTIFSQAELIEEARDYEFNSAYDQYDGQRAEARQLDASNVAEIEYMDREMAAGRLCGACHGYECAPGKVNECSTAQAVKDMAPRKPQCQCSGVGFCDNCLPF